MDDLPHEPPLEFDTLAAQAGIRMRVGDTISTAPPIDPSTTFLGDTIADVHAALGPDPRGYAYARNANPTVAALEQVIASLEGSEAAVAFGSGMAATSGVLLGLGLESGDAVLAAGDLYGVTRSLLLQLQAFDIKTHFVDVLDPSAVQRALTDVRPRLLLFESMSNPLLRVPPAIELIRLAKAHRTVVAIDDTFATPFLFRPLAAGADLVVHSATKYIAGHGDAVAGVVVGSVSFAQRIRNARTLYGGVLSPFDAWLTLRGIRTLHVRMERQCATAISIASWLEEQEWVRRVYYPGLPSHPQRDIAASQFGGRFGGMVALDLVGDRDSTLAFVDALQLVSMGTSLGDVESLVLYPPLSSHRTLGDDELAAAGIGQTLLRMSIGLESPRDLMRDLERAARAAGLVRSPLATAPG
jgi:cystathionine beta-lyase/cystathionine gamma-synthase